MENPLFYLYGKMWKYSKGNHRNVVLYSVMSIMSNLIYAAEPLVVGLFLNMVQSQGVSNDNLMGLFMMLGLLFLIEICVWVLHGPSRMIENRNAFSVRRNYKKHLLKGTMDMPMEWHADHHSGDVIDKIEKGTGALFNFSGRTYELIDTAIVLITAFAVLFFFDALAGGVLLVMTLLTFFILTKFDKQLIPGYGIENKAENKISEKVFDVLSNIVTVVILRVEGHALKSIDSRINDSFNQFNKNNLINEWKWCFASLSGRLAMIIVIGIYLLSNMSDGAILVGTIYILYGYTSQVRNTFYRFAYLYNDIVRYRASVSNAELISDSFNSNDTVGVRRLPKEWTSLDIKGLSFSYKSADKRELHLDNISIDIKKGERIALIGESGGGKTTFLKVFRDLYRPESISLFVDGKIVNGGFNEISDSISLIPQDPEIFASTIRENLTLGLDYSDTRIKVFTDMACFTQIAERLPNKLESSIFEKGVNLSGGEKQRLALARGLLASTDKDIILLDEPTSSVDFENELSIFKNIFSAFPRQAVIASVHRLHLLSLFDKVYYFEGGRVIASGTFEELRKNSSEFNSLWNKYIETRGGEEK